MAFSVISGGGGMPPEPDWRSHYKAAGDLAAARERWAIITRAMQAAGTLAVVNGDSVARLIHFRIIYDEAAKAVARDGVVLAAKRTGVPQINPYWTIMRQADEVLRRLEAELGLSPAHRSRARKAPRRSRSGRPADDYLGNKED